MTAICGWIRANRMLQLRSRNTEGTDADHISRRITSECHANVLITPMEFSAGTAPNAGSIDQSPAETEILPQPLPIASMAASFATIAAGRVPSQALSKATLVDLSHVLEDMVTRHSTRGVIVTGFQYARNWRSEVARYSNELVSEERRVAIFTRDVVPDAVGIEHFRIPRGSGFEQEWFILARTDAFSCGLFGVDQLTVAPGEILEEADRIFDAGWTFAPDVIQEFSERVVEEAAATDASRAEALAAQLYSTPLVDITAELSMEFHHRVFGAMELSKQRLRASRLREREANLRALEATEQMMRLERLSSIGGAAAAFAHEVNNPLQSILSHAEVLRAEAGSATPGTPRVQEQPETDSSLSNDPNTIHESSGEIIGAALRIGEMTRTILDIARQSEVVLEPVELVAWLNSEARSMVGATSGWVDTSGLGTTEVWVRADRQRLYHVVSNLVSNGLRADRRTPPRVVVEIVIAPERVGVRVTDQGSGIPEALRNSIFEPFVTGNREKGGTGLGLTLAQRYAQDQYGSLVVEYTGAEGTAMTLWLPAEDPPAAKERVSAASDVRSNQLPASVLLVDDDQMVRRTMNRLLDKLAIPCRAVASPEEAEAFLIEESFDVCLIDFDLGTFRNGVDVALAWAREGWFAPEQFVLVTGNLAETIPTDFAGRVLLKPFSIDAFREILTQTTTPESTGED